MMVYAHASNMRLLSLILQIVSFTLTRTFIWSLRVWWKTIIVYSQEKSRLCKFHENWNLLIANYIINFFMFCTCSYLFVCLSYWRWWSPIHLGVEQIWSGILNIRSNSFKLSNNQGFKLWLAVLLCYLILWKLWINAAQLCLCFGRDHTQNLDVVAVKITVVEYFLKPW